SQHTSTIVLNTHSLHDALPILAGPKTKAALNNESEAKQSDNTDNTNEKQQKNTEKENNNNNSNSQTDNQPDETKAPAPDKPKENESGSSGFKNTGGGAPSGDAVTAAYSLLGTPYVFGGDNPDTGLDSSGFVNAAFSDKKLSWTHAGMWANDGTRVSEPSPGDVVFFEGTYKNGVSHSGVYIGNNQMIHAGTEATGVEVTSTEIGYWSDRYIGAKRF